MASRKRAELGLSRADHCGQPSDSGNYLGQFKATCLDDLTDAIALVCVSQVGKVGGRDLARLLHVGGLQPWRGDTLGTLAECAYSLALEPQQAGTETRELANGTLVGRLGHGG